MKATHCLNCGRSVHENFCPQCGQRTDTHRIGWHYLFHDLPHSFLHIDKGFFYTARELTIRPGKAIREFLDGKRVNHFRPLGYVLILGVIMSLGIFSQPQVSTAEPGPPDVHVEDGDFEVSGDDVNYMLSHYYGLLTIICIPVYAFFAWLFYRKERNFVEIMTGFMFAYGHTIWFGTLLIIMNWTESVAAGEVLLGLWASLTLIYTFWANTVMFTRYHVMLRCLITLLIVTFGFICSGIVLLLGMALFNSLTH